MTAQDGASTDGSVEILQAYAARHPELRWLSAPDRGPADAVNKGLAMARGTICGIQSADDHYYPWAVAEAVKSGKIEKNSKSAKGWVARHFVLCDRALVYYRTGLCFSPSLH